MRYLKSRDLTQLFKVEDYFFDAYWYVNESEHKWPFMQHEHVGVGRQKMFDNNYTYECQVKVIFYSNFYNYKNAVAKAIKTETNYPTWCNHATAVYLKELGLDDLAEYFKNHDANECFDYLMKEAQSVSGQSIYLIENPNNYAGYIYEKITIAIQKGDKIPGKFDKNGKQLYKIGHVAPVIGKGSDGKIYIANKGAIQNDGVVDIETGFGATLDKISFFEVYR